MLRRVKRVSKLTPKAIGPYVVIKVGGQYGQRVTIQLKAPTSDENKRKREDKAKIVHASQLAPYYD